MAQASEGGEPHGGEADASAGRTGDPKETEPAGLARDAPPMAGVPEGTGGTPAQHAPAAATGPPSSQTTAAPPASKRRPGPAPERDAEGWPRLRFRPVVRVKALLGAAVAGLGVLVLLQQLGLATITLGGLAQTVAVCVAAAVLLPSLGRLAGVAWGNHLVRKARRGAR